ncbi:MAG: acyl-CoA dehydrogenase family protein [Hyphomicrobiales bacterium]
MPLDLETRNQLLDTLRRFVDERLLPLERQVAEDDAIPEELVDEMRALGLFGLSIPEEFGGLGLTMEEEVEVLLVLGRAAPAFRSVFGTNVGIGSQGILMDGTDEQKQKYLPGLASGEIIGSFALTEADVGSDAAAVKTSARLESGDYVLNGTKRFITNAPFAGLFTVMARTNPDNKGAGGVSAFLVEAGSEGLTLGKPEKKMGQQGAHVCDVIFDDCRVPAQNLIGHKAGVGFKTAMKVLDRGRLSISAACCGLAERILGDALSYAMERKQFGQPICEFQLVQAMLADSRAEVAAAKALVRESAKKKDRGEDVATDASCCKMFASEMVGRVADRNVQIHGGNGYIREYSAEQLYRDSRLYRIYEGTTQIQQLIIARNMIRDAAAL